MANHRRQYRTAPKQLQQLSVEIVLSETKKMPVHVVDLSAGGLCMFFETDFDPTFHLGQTLYVHITSPHLDEPLVAPGFVRHREEFDDGRAYGFQFLDWLGIVSQLPPPLVGLFNRRTEPRFKIEPSHSLAVRVE